MVSQRIEEYKEEGRRIEKEDIRILDELCKARGWKLVLGNKHQDMNEHVDCFITVYNKGKEINKISVDVKGIKYESKKDRRDKNSDKKCQYIEFLNVGGNHGWVYGEAMYIAMMNRRGNGFYFVRPDVLLDFAEKKSGLSLKRESLREIKDELKIVGRSKCLWSDRKEKHRLYHRNDRPKECTMLITYEDVHKLCSFKMERKS